MADYAIASDSSQQIRGTLNPVDADGKVSVLDGPVLVTVESGAGDFTQDSTKPMEIVYRSSAADGVTVFNVSGRSLNGPQVSDRVTYTTSLFVPPTPPMTNLGQTFGAPEAKV